MFAPLHVKSEYSLGLGTAPVEALVARVAAHGYPAMALTDVETLAGQVRFHHAARRHGIQAITGVELRAGHGPHAPGRRAGRLVLLARDRAGYQNLCRIVSDRHAGRAPASDDVVEDVELHRSGLFFLSDDAAPLERLRARGVSPSVLRFLTSANAEDVPAGIEPIADPDVVMLDGTDRDLHALVAAIREQRTPATARGLEPPDHSLPPPDEIERWSARRSEHVAATLRIAAACTLDLTRATLHVPAIELGPGESAYAALVRRCREGCRRLPLAAAREAYEDRLAHELDRVARRDLAGYFLVAAEIADHARREGIELLARGSAVGSLIVHLLGISPVDPVANDLLFERFLPAGRADLPDIDLDVPSDRRPALLEWVVRRFGSRRVARVASWSTFRRRAAYRDGLRALGVGAREAAPFLEALPAEEIESEVLGPPPVDRLPPRVRPWLPLIERLIGLPRHLSVHPGGVVIADPEIEIHAPLERAPGGAIVTQYDLTSLARIGLVKFDLLGNRALGAADTARRWLGRDDAAAAPPLEGDAPTLATIARAETLGCFQIESPAMRSVLRRMPVRDLHDLTAALAIVRPGPASGTAKEAYLRRARGEEAPVPRHPRLGGILARTHGLLLFEEDLVRSIAALTGRTLDQADELRAALVEAGDDLEARAILEHLFVRDAAARGLAAAEAREVWRELARFAAYSFNRAHALSYAGLAARCARLKTHHPQEFACGVLDHYGGQYPLRAIAAEFARRGVTLLAPSVQRSTTPCSLEGDAVRLGLGAIQHLTATTRARILELRPFRDLLDFLQHVRPSAAEIDALVLAGACDDLAPLSPEGYPFAHEALLPRLHALEPAAAVMGLAVPRSGGEGLATYRRLVRSFHEVRFLGMHPSGHPMAALREEARLAGCRQASELATHAGASVRFAGIVSASRRLITQDGRVMQFVTLEDETGLIETIVFPDAYADLGDPIRAPGPYLVTGRIAIDHGDLHLVLADVIPFHMRDAGGGLAAAAASDEEARS